MKSYLNEQAELHFQNFLDSGRAKGFDFSQTYKNLQKLKGDKGLSNSEVALAAALWAASQKGCKIDELSLSEFFPAAGKTRHSDVLKSKLLRADGIVMSTPVYFGDRSSLAQDLIDFIRNDLELL